VDKKEAIISLKDGLILLGLGGISVWLLIFGEREPDAKPDEEPKKAG
jgi:hypothetical protein